MKEHGIKVLGTSKLVVATDSKHTLPITLSFLKRNFHGDRGSQYCSNAFLHTLDECGMRFEKHRVAAQLKDIA